MPDEEVRVVVKSTEHAGYDVVELYQLSAEPLYKITVFVLRSDASTEAISKTMIRNLSDIVEKEIAALRE